MESIEFTCDVSVLFTSLGWVGPHAQASRVSSPFRDHSVVTFIRAAADFDNIELPS